MANRKPIRWAVPLGGESYMGLAAYFLTHEENMRQAFSQPSRRARRTLPDGTTIDYIMNDVVDFIMISTPQGMQRVVGKNMTWDKLPPFEEGTTSTIDLSQMTEDPNVEGGYYCTVSVINGTDENGRTLPAEFSVEMGEDSVGWSIKQGIRQLYPDFTGWTFEQFMSWYASFEPYKVDGKSATLLLGPDVSGECDIIAEDGKTKLTVSMESLVEYSDRWVAPIYSSEGIATGYYLDLEIYLSEGVIKKYYLSDDVYNEIRNPEATLYTSPVYSSALEGSTYKFKKDGVTVYESPLWTINDVDSYTSSGGGYLCQVDTSDSYNGTQLRQIWGPDGVLHEITCGFSISGSSVTVTGDAAFCNSFGSGSGPKVYDDESWGIFDTLMPEGTWPTGSEEPCVYFRNQTGTVRNIVCTPGGGDLYALSNGEQIAPAGLVFKSCRQ